MKKRAKIIATAKVVAIASLIITADPTSSPGSPQNCPVSEVVEVSKTYTPPIEEKPLVDEEMSKISTQIEEIIEPTTEESSTPQKVKIVYHEIGLMDLTNTTALAKKLKIA